MGTMLSTTRVSSSSAAVVCPKYATHESRWHARTQRGTTSPLKYAKHVGRTASRVEFTARRRWPPTKPPPSTTRRSRFASRRFVSHTHTHTKNTRAPELNEGRSETSFVVVVAVLVTHSGMREICYKSEQSTKTAKQLCHACDE